MFKHDSRSLFVPPESLVIDSRGVSDLDWKLRFSLDHLSFWKGQLQMVRFSLWSELGRSRWSLPEHTIHISSLCPFWWPASRPTLPSTSVGTWVPPGDLRVACG